MKKLVFISLTIVYVATSAFAQNADIKVSYDAYFQRVDNGKADEKSPRADVQKRLIFRFN